jgi:DNA-binding NarL/FixJ family response regulator
MQSGARGYILKDSVAEEVATAIRTIMKGDHYYGAGVRNPMEPAAAVAAGSAVSADPGDVL